MPRYELGGMGWERDHPDFRDFTLDTPSIKGVLTKSRPLRSAKKKAPAKIDLRKHCSPIEDQEDLGSCTANAGAGLLEYYQLRAHGTHLDASRLFLYKVTRNLLGIAGDTGAYLRTTMKAMVLFGVPPEKYWDYLVDEFDAEPPSFCYAFAQNYQAINYYRLDPPGVSGKKLLENVKIFLAAGLPSMFGFSVFSSMPGIGEGTGDIPFPGQDDYFRGGHAVAVVGYDDAKKIDGDRGALLIRNSWGEAWGEDGYGWLPYRYVTEGLAVDFWSLLEAEFVDTELFE